MSFQSKSWIVINYIPIMSTTNAHASSSKPAGKGKEHVKGGGKGKGPGKGRKEQPRMKSNMIKRQQGDEELKDLQARIDAFVRLPHNMQLELMIRYHPILWRHSHNCRYRSVRSKVSPHIQEFEQGIDCQALSHLISSTQPRFRLYQSPPLSKPGTSSAQRKQDPVKP